MIRVLTAAVAALTLSVSAGVVLAADRTPPGPIKLIIAFVAGGGADTQARLIAESLEARHGWNIIPEQVRRAWTRPRAMPSPPPLPRPSAKTAAR